MKHLRKLWNDDCGGGLLTAEFLFLYSTLVLGAVSGLVAVRQAALSELVETGQSLLALNQSYNLSGQSNCVASSAGSSASDSSNTIFNFGASANGSLVSQHPLD